MSLYEDNEKYDGHWTCPLCGDVVGYYGGDDAVDAIRNGHNAAKHAYSEYRATIGGHVLTDEDFRWLMQQHVRWSVPQGWPPDKP